MPDQFKMLAERRTPCPPATARSSPPAQRVTPGHPDQSAWPPMPAQRRVDLKSSSEQNGRTPTTTAPKYRAKRPPNLSWPNNVVVKPRKRTTPKTATTATTPAPRPAGPTTTPSTSWQWPSQTQPDTSRWVKSPSPTSPRSARSAKKNDRWDKDSKWIPPKTATTMTTASSRAKRSTAKPVNYNDDDSHMDAAFSNWS